MLQITQIHMEGGQHLEHIAELRWVEVDQPGGFAISGVKHSTRSQMYEFVKNHPKGAFAMNSNGTTYAYLEAVNGAHVQYVKTLPDGTTSDNLLSLPRY